MMLKAMLGSQHCCAAWCRDAEQESAPAYRSSGLQVMIYMGGMQGKEPEIIESLAKYVTDEYQNKCQETVDTSEWPRRYSVCMSVLTHLYEHFYQFSHHRSPHLYDWTCDLDDMQCWQKFAVCELSMLCGGARHVHS